MNRAILTHYVGATNTKGSRYVATAPGGARVIIACDYSLKSEDNHKKAIYTLCAKMGWDASGLVFGWTERGLVAVGRS